MKKTLFVFMALVLVSAVTFGQSVSFSAGAKGGIDLGSWGGEDYNDLADLADGKGVALGFALGGFVEVAFSEQFSVQPEVLFFQWRSKIKADPDDIIFKANSVTIPVLAKGTFPVGGGDVFLVGGPAVALVLGDVLTEIGDTEIEEAPDNAAVFGLSVGAGYEQAVGPGTISAELRYNRILTETFDGDDIYPQGVSVLIGYGFDL